MANTTWSDFQKSMEDARRAGAFSHVTDRLRQLAMVPCQTMEDEARFVALYNEEMEAQGRRQRPAGAHVCQWCATRFDGVQCPKCWRRRQNPDGSTVQDDAPKARVVRKVKAAERVVRDGVTYCPPAVAEGALFW
jgi:hypothetical protein